jgi:hypothetical protein
MLHPSSIWQALIESALNLSARVNQANTGSLYQETLLRMMGVSVQGPVWVGHGASFLRPDQLSLGRYCSFGCSARIVSWVPVTIGDDFLASDLLNINSGSHDPVTLKPKLTSITIGNRVWCGTGVTICAGVTIGDDVIIGAESLVTKSIPSGCIAYGAPAVPARMIDRTGERRWSPWLERSDFYDATEYSAFRRWLQRMKARI